MLIRYQKKSIVCISVLSTVVLGNNIQIHWNHITARPITESMCVGKAFITY